MPQEQSPIPVLDDDIETEKEMIDYWLKQQAKEWVQTMEHIPWAYAGGEADTLAYVMLGGQYGWQHIVTREHYLMVFDDAANARDWCEQNRYFFAEPMTIMAASSMELALYCQRKKLEGYEIEDRGSRVPCR